MRSTEIVEYRSPDDFLVALDGDINELRKLLAENLRKLEDMRRRIDQQKLVIQTIRKIFPQYKETEPKNIIELKDAELIIGPTIEQELEALEKILDLMNRKLNILLSLRKELDVLSQYKAPVKIIVYYLDGIPRKIHISY